MTQAAPQTEKGAKFNWSGKDIILTKFLTSGRLERPACGRTCLAAAARQKCLLY